jgi:hypothetical protein
VSRRFSATVRSGANAGSWNTGARPLARAWAGERSFTARPATSTTPASGLSTPLRILTSVLLPAPLAPTSPWISPRSTARSTERRATTDPYRLATSRALSSDAAIVYSPGPLQVKSCSGV